jgi:hypothetical protein
MLAETLHHDIDFSDTAAVGLYGFRGIDITTMASKCMFDLDSTDMRFSPANSSIYRYYELRIREA